MTNALSNPWKILLPSFATTALGLVGNIYAQNQANEAEKKYEAFNTNRMKDLDSWFNKEYYQNYLDSTTAKSALSRFNAQMKERQEALKNSAVAGGATPEAVIASQGESDKAYNDAVNNLVGMGDQKRDQTMYRYKGLMQPLEANQANILGNRVGQWQTFANNIGGAMKGLNDVWAAGGFDTVTPTKKPPIERTPQGDQQMVNTLKWAGPQGS